MDEKLSLTAICVLYKFFRRRKAIRGLGHRQATKAIHLLIGRLTMTAFYYSIAISLEVFVIY